MLLCSAHSPSKVPDTELLPRDTLQQRIASARTLEVIEDVRPTLKETFEGLDIWKLVVLVDLRKSEHSMSPSLSK